MVKRGKTTKVKGKDAGKEEEILTTMELRVLSAKNGMSMESLLDLIDSGRPLPGSAPSMPNVRNLAPVTQRSSNQESGKGDSGKKSWAEKSDVAASNPGEGSDLGPPMQIPKESDAVAAPVAAEAVKDIMKGLKKPKSYSDMVRNNRTGDGMSLNYVRPGKEVVITEEAWNEGAKLWKHTLMGVVVSHILSYPEIGRAHV